MANEDAADIPEVFQREYIITNAYKHKFVQTYGVGPCIALSLFNKKTNQALLAHIDAQTNVNREVLALIHLMGNDENIEARVFGGIEGDKTRLATRVMEVLKEGKVTITESYIERPKNSFLSVMLNTETGELLLYREAIRSTSYQVFEAKVSRIKWGARLYRHEDSLGGGDRVEVSEEEEDIFLPLF